MEDDFPPEEVVPHGTSRGKTTCSYTMKKYQMALVASACLMNIFAARTCLSEQTERSLPKPYYFPDDLLRHVYTGSYLLAQIPAGLAATTLPPHRLFELGIALSSVINIMFPFSCQIEPTFGMVTLLRAIQGIADALLIPALHSLWQHHTTARNRPIVVTVPLAGAYLGACLGNYVNYELSQHFDWTASFYVFGAAGAALGYVWHLIASETADSKRAKRKQRRCSSFAAIYYAVDRPKLRTIPYCKIFTSLRVWAITIASFVRFWTISTLMVILLEKLTEILGTDEGSAEAFELFRCPVTSFALTFGACLFTLFHLKFSTTTVRKLATTPPFLIFPLILYLTMQPLDIRTTLACVFVSIFLGGVSESGFNVNHLDIAPRFAGLLMSITMSAGLTAEMGSQLTITHLTTNQTLALLWSDATTDNQAYHHPLTGPPQQPEFRETDPDFGNSSLTDLWSQLGNSTAVGPTFEPGTHGWHLVAYIAMGLNVFAGLLFAILGSGEEQAWARREEEGDTEMLSIAPSTNEQL